MQAVRRAVASDLDAVNQLIIDKLQSSVGMVESIGHYIVDGGGKRMRPLVVLLTARALGYQGDLHTRFATVIEFIHTATLLHDDVVDLSSLRRGRPTVNANWGNAPSVLVGDFIYTRAFQLMVAMDVPGILPLMADTTNRIAEGEVLQLELAGNPDCREADYYRVIENKTAILFAAAAQGAAIIAGCTPATVQAAGDYGLHLGMAFQLIDDLLDYDGDSTLMGKNVGDDLAEGKPTLPLLYTMRTGTAAQAAMVRRAIVERSATELDGIVHAVRESGALEYTRQQAVRHQRNAVAAIAALPAGDYRDHLCRVAELSVARDR